MFADQILSIARMLEDSAVRCLFAGGIAEALQGSYWRLTPVIDFLMPDEEANLNLFLEKLRILGFFPLSFAQQEGIPDERILLNEDLCGPILRISLIAPAVFDQESNRSIAVMLEEDLRAQFLSRAGLELCYGNRNHLESSTVYPESQRVALRRGIESSGRLKFEWLEEAGLVMKWLGWRGAVASN